MMELFAANVRRGEGVGGGALAQSRWTERVQHSTSTVIINSTAQHNAAEHRTAEHSTVRYVTLRYGTGNNNTVQDRQVSYCSTGSVRVQ